MKLYTEQQIRIAIAIGYDWRDQNHVPQDHMIDNFINSLTPIELPTDEEIKAEFIVGNQIFLDRIHGAKWMRAKIQGNNYDRQETKQY